MNSQLMGELELEFSGTSFLVQNLSDRPLLLCDDEPSQRTMVGRTQFWTLGMNKTTERSCRE